MELKVHKLLFFAVLICNSTLLKAQVLPTLKSDSVAEVPRVYAEKMPFLPGGERLSNERRRLQLINAIQTNLVLPSGFTRPKGSARVFVSFVLTPNAQVTEVKLVGMDNKLMQECAAAAITAVQRLSGFTAGFEKGRPVPVHIAVPVEFGLTQK